MTYMELAEKVAAELEIASAAMTVAWQHLEEYKNYGDLEMAGGVVTERERKRIKYIFDATSAIQDKADNARKMVVIKINSKG